MADDEAAPEDDVEDGEEGEGGAKKKGKPKLMTLLLFVGLPALVLILGGAAGAMFLLGGGEDEHAEAGEGGEAHAGADHGGDGHGGGGGHGAPAHDVVFYELPEILVNIQSEDGVASYLKLSISLELDSEETAHRIEPAMPRVMDRYLSFLRELRAEELVGSSANYRLHLELLRRVNLAVAPDEVQAVLIEDMLIQ